MGFTVPDELFAGYGLGLDERWRALPDLHVVVSDELPAANLVGNTLSSIGLVVGPAIAGVLLALDKLASLPPGLTVGLDALL